MSQTRTRRIPPNVAIVGVVLLALIGVALVGLYLYNASNSQNVSHTSNNNLNVPGNGIVETIPVTGNSNIVVSCNQCQLGFTVNSTVTINIDVTGNYNTITINGGQTNLIVDGNYNILYCQNTQLLNQHVTGTSDTILH